MQGVINEGDYEMPKQNTESASAAPMVKYREAVMNTSAYTASEAECGKTDGITASGAPAEEGITIASDDLPFGTEVVIDGHTYIVQDRFGGNYRNRIDIYMDSVSRANTFGRREILVQIREHDRP